MRSVYTAEWHANLKWRHRDVGHVLPAIPNLCGEERRWVGIRDKRNVDYVSTVTNVLRNPLAGNVRRLPCDAPMHDAVVNGTRLVRGRLNYNCGLWETVVLRDHLQKTPLLSYLADGVSVFEFLTDAYRGT